MWKKYNFFINTNLLKNCHKWMCAYIFGIVLGKVLWCFGSGIRQYFKKEIKKDTASHVTTCLKWEPEAALRFQGQETCHRCRVKSFQCNPSEESLSTQRPGRAPWIVFSLTFFWAVWSDRLVLHHSWRNYTLNPSFYEQQTIHPIHCSSLLSHGFVDQDLQTITDHGVHWYTSHWLPREWRWSSFPAFCAE